MEPPRRLTHIVTAQEEGKTVDTLLRHVLCLSSGSIRRAKGAENGITLDGCLVFTNALVHEGQTLSILVGEANPPLDLLLTPGPLSILYEDADLLVVDKMAPLPVHPGPGNLDRSLGNYLMHYYKTREISARFHPVNRLDAGTSGLLTIAKHPHAHERLQSFLHGGGFSRTYLAVCEGVPTPPAGTIALPIGRREGSVLRREVSPTGAPAVTHYRLHFTDGKRSLLALGLETGRTHQIRVHLSHLGHPVTGDFLYGTEIEGLPGRFALHSHTAAFFHPVTGAQLSFTAPLPPELLALLPGLSETIFPWEDSL